MRKLPSQINGWICTDPDCGQYQKKLNDTTYEMIRYLDYPDDKWYIMRDTIDIEHYLLDDIESMVASYYESVEQVKKIYQDRANAIISECIFDSIGTGDYSYEWYVDSEDEAVELIYEIIIR